MLSSASCPRHISSCLVGMQELRQLICMSACCKQINKTWRVFPICFFMVLLSLLFLLCFVVLVYFLCLKVGNDVTVKYSIF